MIRNEYKLWILKNYLIPSKRYILTVHNLTNTELSKLDIVTDKYTKKWAGIPKSATNVVIHLKEALDIPSISHTYTEAHNVSHARTQLQGEICVNNVIDNTLQREQHFSHKKCTTTEAEIMFKSTLHEQTNSTHIPRFTTKHHQNILITKLRRLLGTKLGRLPKRNLWQRQNR